MIDEARLDVLLNAYFDQRLEEAERSELEAMLLQSSRAREKFRAHGEQHGLLREWALRENGATAWETSARESKGIIRIAWIAAALAACVTVGFWLFRSPAGSDHATGSIARQEADAVGSPANEVALLADQVNVEWPSGITGFESGSALPKGPFVLEKGLVRLDFYSGAKVYLEGPASLDLISPELARLNFGKLTAQVPAPAHGFTVLSNSMRVVDRGTEFGMSAGTDDHVQVHVFDGEVELFPMDDASQIRSIYGGGAVAFHDGSSTDLPADRSAFANPLVLLEAAKRDREQEWRDWQAYSKRLSRSRDLLIYYDFLEIRNGVVTNRSAQAPEESDGILIGCEPVPGRWKQKTALGFARTSDRLRFRIEGSAPSVTMQATVRVDSLPHDHNALLSMSPGEIGEVHWKLDREGRMLLGLRAVRDLDFGSWERLISPPVVGENDLGHWLTLTTVIDGEAREMRHYVNGKEVAFAPINRATPVRLGKANLGNFDSPEDAHVDTTVTRNFNGRFAEFALFTRALSPEELQAYP